MAGGGLSVVAGLSGTQRRQAVRPAAAGRAGPDGGGLRRGLQEPRERRLPARLPHPHRLLCLRGGLPRDDPRPPPPDARRAEGRPPRTRGARLRRYGSALRETAGRGGRAGVDRTAVAARHAAIRIVRTAGRADPDGRSRRLRRPVRGGGLRPLPPLSRELPHGGSRPLSDARHGALHRLPHHRKGTRHGGRSPRLDIRLRRLPELLSPQPPRTAPPRPGVPWTRRRGSRWTKRASGSFSAARPSPAAACGASSETSAENDSTTARAERSRASAAPARPPSNGKRTFPKGESPLSHISPNGPAADRSPPGFRPPYFVSSVSAALAFSAAGPSVTFRKAAMAWSFISLAL